MRKSIVVATLIVLCSASLAACGDSSSSTSSTKTATVPAGKLGAQNSERCEAPRISGTTFTSFSATSVSCGVATTGLLSVYQTNKYAGWTCQQRISGRNVSTTCTNDGNTAQSFSAGWRVS